MFRLCTLQKAFGWCGVRLCIRDRQDHRNQHHCPQRESDTLIRELLARPPPSWQASRFKTKP